MEPNDRERAVAQRAEPAAVGADPEVAAAVDEHRLDDVGGQAVVAAVDGEAAVAEPVEAAAVGSDPEIAVAVLGTIDQMRSFERPSFVV